MDLDPRASGPFSNESIEQERKQLVTAGIDLKELNVLFLRSYRFAAYRQFTWWVHNKGTKGVRRVVPSCVVSRIRDQFPSPDGTCWFHRRASED